MSPKRRAVRYLAQCPRGLEAALSRELGELGCREVETVGGGALFTADAEAAARALVWTRTAVRVLEPGEDREVTQDLQVLAPRLWSPRSPDLYTLHAEIVEDEVVVDDEMTRVGIRRIEITKDGFRINGERMFLRGTNRHQEYP